jgi:hypothetical protein
LLTARPVVGRPDHLALLLGFPGDEPNEVCGRNSPSAFTQAGSV